jgi:hypothetical protein
MGVTPHDYQSGALMQLERIAERFIASRLPLVRRHPPLSNREHS